MGRVAPADVQVVATEVADRLSSDRWQGSALAGGQTSISPTVPAATEIAVFALNMSGKGPQARRGGRVGRLVRSFALAACIALTTGLAACDKPNADAATNVASSANLSTAAASDAVITAPARQNGARYTDLVLVDAGSQARPWAIAVPPGGDTPVLIDRNGSGMDNVGSVYRLAARSVPVGTRDGASQFLDPLSPAESTGSDATTAQTARDGVSKKWGEDERFLAATRAIAGQPSVLDAAYNAAAAVAAGGTHTYLNGVVLRVDSDKPVIHVIDRGLLESGRPTRAEDVVYVAIRQSEQALYEPGQVVNLRDVVINAQKTDVNGQQTTINVVNAALNGARVEPAGRVDLQALLQPRLQRIDQDLSAQSQAVSAAAPPAPTSAPTNQEPRQTQPVIVNNYRGPSFVDDFLIWMWLTNTGFYRGPSVIIAGPPFYAGRPVGNYYYSAPPPPSPSAPSTVAGAQAASRSTALEAARTSVSGQAAGTGGGVAATNKSAADASARVSAATAKSASVAGDVSAASVGKSVASVPSNASASTASRSAGSTAAGVGASSSGGSGNSGGKGISGGSGTSSGSGGFGGRGGSSGSGGGSSSS